MSCVCMQPSWQDCNVMRFWNRPIEFYLLYPARTLSQVHLHECIDKQISVLWFNKSVPGPVKARPTTITPRDIRVKCRSGQNWHFGMGRNWHFGMDPASANWQSGIGFSDPMPECQFRPAQNWHFGMTCREPHAKMPFDRIGFWKYAFSGFRHKCLSDPNALLHSGWAL